VRIGKPDLLTAKLKQLQGNDTVAVTGAHTFGSLIKAYGHAKDINGVWRCWKEMGSLFNQPTPFSFRPTGRSEPPGVKRNVSVFPPPRLSNPK